MTKRTTLAHTAIALISAPLKAVARSFLPPVATPAPAVHLRILPQRLDQASPQASAGFFTAIHAADPGPVALEISAQRGHLAFGIACPVAAYPYIESQLAAQYPGVLIEEHTDHQPAMDAYHTIGLGLALPSCIPLRSFDGKAADPLAGLLAALAVVASAERTRISIVTESVPHDWQKDALAYANTLRNGQEPLSDGWAWLITEPLRELVHLSTSAVHTILMGRDTPRQESNHTVLLTPSQLDTITAIEEKARWPGFRTAIRLEVWAASQAAARERVLAVVDAFQLFTQPHLNRFVPHTCRSQDARTGIDVDRPKHHSFILSIPELACLWHLPGKDLDVAGITWATARRAEPPTSLPSATSGLLGQTAFRSDHRPFGLLEQDRFRHLYMVGKAGTGKSTLLRNLIIQDMRAGHGLALLDPHGDLYDALLDAIPPERVKDIVLVDPGDQDYPVSLNPLELPDPTQRAQVASALVDILKRSFEHRWGPRLEYILRNCILTLLEVPNSTIMGIPRLLANDGYRAWAVANVQDPVMRFFWLEEFAGMLTNPRLVTEAISPVQNKVGQFLSAPLLRHILAQPKSTIDVQDVMESSKILLVNLSKGRIGEDSSSLLGAMIISSLHFTAMRRVAQPESERNPFFLYADEFQSFATSTFASILSEARKYRLGLILAHQYIAQLPDEVRDAIFGNVGSLVSFTVGPEDARFLERQFAPALAAEDLMNLDRYHMVIHLMVEGTTLPAFTAVGMPPVEGTTGLREKVIAVSRTAYARDVAIVQKKIRTWSERVYQLPRKGEVAHQAVGGPRSESGRLPLINDPGSPATDQMADNGE